MELELRNYNMLEYNLFKRSHIEFPDDNTLRMVLPDSVIAREKSEILVEYLHKVFCERCGMDLKVEMEFEETEESKYRKNAVLQIRQEVENVLKNAGMRAQEKAEEEEKKKEKSSGKDAKKEKNSGSQEKKTFEKKGQKGDFRGGFRRDSNPDVIYGRDFEGEAIPLESIT